MPFNGSGTFVSLAPPNFPAIPFTTILASMFNANMNDVFTNGLTKCITRDGQSPPTANLPMAGFKFTALGNGSADTDSAALGQTLSVRGQVGVVDWDTRTTNGIFEATAASLVTPSANFPPTQALGQLEVIAQGALVSHIYVTSNDTYYRQKVGGVWTIWTLGVANKNYILNSAFAIWELGTSLGSGSGKRYLADMFYTDSTGTTYTPTRQPWPVGQVDVDPSAVYFQRVAVVTAAGVGNYCLNTTAMEGVRTLAGKTVTISFYMKCSAANPVSIELAQNFGSGGGASATVTTFAGKVTTSTSWARYSVTIAVPSISGKTIGTDGRDYLGVTVWYDAGANFNARTGTLGQRSGTYDTFGLKIEEGSAITRYDVPNAVETLALCRRYYVNLTGVANFCAFTFAGDISNTKTYYVATKFGTRMVSVPIISVAGVIANITFAAGIAATTEGAVVTLVSSVTGTGGTYQAGYVADCTY